LPGRWFHTFKHRRGRYPAVVRWNKITLVGVGLLGGSLGLAIKQRHLARRVEGYVRREASVAESRGRGAVDRATLDLASAVSGADLVVLCTPLGQMRPLVERMLPALKRGAIVTDVGSTKAGVVRQLERLVASAGAHFVGSHPMAGGEKTGVAAARADLFERAICIVTPTRRTHPAARRCVEALWRGVGGRVLRLSPAQHDRLVSRSSHLPHLLAATLVTCVLDARRSPLQAAVCANGFRDTTRIASGSPEMWRDIALANRVFVGAALSQFRRRLDRVQKLLRAGDAEALAAFFRTAKSRRDHWVARWALPDAH